MTDRQPDRYRKRVLIADSDPTIRFAMRDYLEKSGFDVAETASWRGAEQCAGRRTFDVLIAELRLPDGSAAEWLPRLRRLSFGLSTIILSRDSGAVAERDSVRAGAVRFFVKPLRLETLHAALAELTGVSRSRARPNSDPPSPARHH